MTSTSEAAVRRETPPMSILIVDDESAIRDTCAAVAQQTGMKAVAVPTAEEALDVLERTSVDILLTDLKLPQANGVELLKVVHDLHPEVAVVVLTQYGSIESAVEVTRLGALDYVTKPFRIEELRARLERVAHAVELQQENRLLREQLQTRPGFGGLIGVSLKMQRVYKTIEKVSQHEYPVLLLGESGTWKGTRGPQHSLSWAPEGPPFRSRGLLRACSHADRIGTIRLRQRRIYRRYAGQAGAARSCPGRNALPG